nr:MAG TPA: Protein of unknown function (DUF1351) [Caudoviricetes sp.]
MTETKKRYVSKTVRQNDSLAEAQETRTAAKKAKSEVDFADVDDFKFNAPVVAEKSNSIIVSSNADKLKIKIQAIVDRYKGTELTEENVDYVKTLKSNFVSLRTGIERERKEWNKVYIDPMKKTVDAVCKELQSIVAEGENALGSQLEAYDQKRKDALTEVLEDYRQDAIRKHNLREEYAEQLVLKDKYYNKTQNEEDSADDIEEQAKELEKRQTEYDSSVALIKAECEGSALVPQTYIDQLKYRSAMELILKIKNDKKESQRLYEEIKAKEEAGEKIVLGKPVEEARVLMDDTGDDFDEVKVRKLELTYKASQTQAVTDLFSQLKKLGVAYKFIK